MPALDAQTALRAPDLRGGHFNMVSSFRVAPLGVQKQKADRGLLPLLCCLPLNMHACTTPTHGVPVLTAKSLLTRRRSPFS